MISEYAALLPQDRDKIVERIVTRSLSVARAKLENNHEDLRYEKNKLEFWLARYVFSVLQDSEDITDEPLSAALRAMESDDIDARVADPSPDPSDALAPDPGTVACPSCDEPVRGHYLYEKKYDLDNPVMLSYDCGKCGYSESRDL